MVTGGANLGRIGVITNRERHPGSFDVVHVKDANGNSFATRLSNIFVIGKVSPCLPSPAQGTREGWLHLTQCEPLMFFLCVGRVGNRGVHEQPWASSEYFRDVNHERRGGLHLRGGR